jgi:hypothetical protein
VTWRFNLLRLRPIIYPLQGFGIPCELERVYDYRHVPKINRSLLRDTAANVLQVQEGTASILAQDATDSVSALDPDDDLSVSTTASKLKHRLGSIFVPGSTQDGDSMTIPSPSAARRALMRRDSQSTMLTSVPLLSAEHNKETRRLHGPSLQRLVPKFPVRDKRDRSDNIFEARAVGIGAARVSISHILLLYCARSNKLFCAHSLQEEDEKALQDELKKRQVQHVCLLTAHHCVLFVTWMCISSQWAALIDERRAKQAADRQREIEAQQQNFLAASLAEKKQVSNSGWCVNWQCNLTGTAAAIVRNLTRRSWSWRSFSGRHSSPSRTNCACYPDSAWCILPSCAVLELDVVWY